MFQIPAIPGVSLIRLPFDILSAAYVLTVIALAETRIITLPQDGPNQQNGIQGPEGMDLSHPGLYL